MTSSPLIQPFESGDALLFKVLRFLILAGGTLLLCFAGILDLAWPQQIVLGILTVALVIWLDRSSSSYLITLTLLLVSVFSTFRYGYWRYATTGRFLFAPGSAWRKLDVFFIALLLLAETYAFLTLFLGYLQTLWPLRRIPVALPDDPESWPAVDLLIPTFNEPLSLVKFTALAAMNIDWPADQLNVYILDDGKREEFRKFAEDAGIGYMTRETNEHAKAGNINNALASLDSPYVAIFDCDHVPTRSFLQITLGWFLRDDKLGMLQTPHHFYSPDPFERNLDQFRMIPNEGDFFYSVVQDGNDFWNSTFFCGSCAVLRRSALDEIGGIAVETVTEDAHTSLRMQMSGWNTAYINIPQAAGLATERLSGHIRQRIRWARGMIQILRTDNPLFARGLNLAQRLCYFNSMTHFLYALPRLIFLTAPLVYLIFGRVNLPGYWAAILAYAFPHLVLASVAHSRIQGRHRHSYWNEIYETVLAPYILIPTVLALINPKLGSFDVTAKGGVVNRKFFDRRIASPYLFLIAINLIGMLCAIPRFVQFPGADRIFPLNIPANMYDGNHIGTIAMNLVWACFNLVVLGVATSVAWESRQRRQSVRLAIKVPADVAFANGATIRGITADISSGGLMIRMDRSFIAHAGEALKITLPVLDGNATLPATVAGISGSFVRAQFDPLNLQQEEALTMVLYSRADTWLGWGESRETDKPIVSIGKIIKLSFNGIRQTLRDETKPRTRLATSILPLLFIAVLSTVSTSQVAPSPTPQSATPPSPSTQPLKAIPTPPPATDAFDNTVTLADLGVANTIVLRGADASRTIRFSLPQTQVVKTATLHLRYHLSPALLPSISHLKVSLNGTLFATIPVTAPPATQLTPTSTNATHSESNSLLETTLTLPAEALARSNELTFEFIGHSTTTCEDPSNSALWSHVDNTSTIEFTGSLVALPDDLKSLPAPFYDARADLRPSIPIVFLTQPSPKTLQAAGIVASWFGIFTSSRPIRFPVSIAAIPKGNAIVIAENTGTLPASLHIATATGPTIAIRTNPSDPYAKILVLTGNSADEVLTAAIALSLPRNLFAGDTVSIPSLKMPALRAPDDAPRWLSTETVTPIGDILDSGNDSGDLETDGANPIAIYPHLPPDLYYGTRQNLNLHLAYRYNSIPLADGSTLQVNVNGSYISSTPLPHTSKTQVETVVPLPVSTLRPFSNSLLMQFLFKLPKKDECQDPSPGNNLNGSFLKDSYLDIQGIPHWATLPNLEIFANAGYPFTRRADLSDTAVVLPDTPTAEEIEMYLTLMGHFGAQTGYPVLNVSVTNPDGMTPDRTKDDRGKDYLVLGTVDDQPAISRLNPSLPVGVDGSGLHIQDTQGFFAPLQHAWWKVRSSERVQPGQLETDGGLPDALIEAIEWPAGSNRSAVVIVLRDQDVVSNFLSTFLKTSQSSDISQSVSVLHGSRFSSYRIGGAVYHVGSLSRRVQLKILFEDNQWLMVLAVLGFCLLMAAILRSILRRKARFRLQGNG
ncbi:MAG TPA: UDP-forming cellulose synthase catalytic subunit [Edaphobacter sp.]|nr:UDP-forming cellulose synthase catalytic subunit [Edaphobacter sp.]